MTKDTAQALIKALIEEHGLPTILFMLRAEVSYLDGEDAEPSRELMNVFEAVNVAYNCSVRRQHTLPRRTTGQPSPGGPHQPLPP